MRIGGGKGIRTPGLFIANEALYQLSYTPNRLGRRRLERVLYLLRFSRKFHRFRSGIRIAAESGAQIGGFGNRRSKFPAPSGRPLCAWSVVGQENLLNSGARRWFHLQPARSLPCGITLRGAPARQNPQHLICGHLAHRQHLLVGERLAAESGRSTSSGTKNHATSIPSARAWMASSTVDIPTASAPSLPGASATSAGVLVLRSEESSVDALLCRVSSFPPAPRRQTASATPACKPHSCPHEIRPADEGRKCPAKRFRWVAEHHPGSRRELRIERPRRRW